MFGFDLPDRLKEKVWCCAAFEEDKGTGVGDLIEVFVVLTEKTQIPLGVQTVDRAVAVLQICTVAFEAVVAATFLHINFVINLPFDRMHEKMKKM